MHARGTPDNPGLGLGLVREENSQCHGVALLIDASRREEALKKIWNREMWTDIYAPVWRPVNTEAGPLKTVVFEVDEASRQFAGFLPLPEAAQYIASAIGKFGPCRDYLHQTAASLHEIGVRDDEIESLCALVRGLS